MPSRKVETKPPVSMQSPAVVKRGLEVTVGKVTKVSARAKVPGEVSGPGLSFALSVRNNSAKAVDISTVVVNLMNARGQPANRISTAPARPFAGTVPAGSAASGIYVFVVRSDQRDPVTLAVALSGDLPVIVFKGKVD